MWPISGPSSTIISYIVFEHVPYPELPFTGQGEYLATRDYCFGMNPDQQKDKSPMKILYKADRARN